MSDNTITIELSDEAMDLLREIRDVLASAGPAAPPADDKKAKAAAKKAEKAEAKAAKEAEAADGDDDGDGPTREEVRDALKAHASLEGKDAAIAILNDTGGAASISELEEDKFQAVIDKTNE